jgi:hypothetical protein
MRVLFGAPILSLVAATTVWAQTTGTAEDNLQQKNIALPPPVTSMGSYVPAVRSGNLLFLSGVGPGLSGHQWLLRSHGRGVRREDRAARTLRSRHG